MVICEKSLKQRTSAKQVIRYKQATRRPTKMWSSSCHHCDNAWCKQLKGQFKQQVWKYQQAYWQCAASHQLQWSAYPAFLDCQLESSRAQWQLVLATCTFDSATPARCVKHYKSLLHQLPANAIAVPATASPFSTDQHTLTTHCSTNLRWHQQRHQQDENNTAAGTDGLPAELLKNATDPVMQELVAMFSCVWPTDAVLNDWTNVIITARVTILSLCSQCQAKSSHTSPCPCP